jgi:hypothetical protein
MPENEVVLLVGAGAVCNAWDPVRAALRGAACEDVCSDEGANFALARLVNAAREIELIVLDSPRRRRSAQRRVALKSRGQIRERLRETKRKIASALENQPLTPRAEFPAVLEAVRREGSALHVVTTNWDSAVERSVDQHGGATSFDYLHGTSRSANGLYLPSEVAEERYRSRRERRGALRARGRATRLVGQATCVALYGLSVSALDAELGQVLASGLLGSPCRKVWVFDPWYPKVCERIEGLLPRGFHAQGSHPRRLGDVWTFSAETYDSELKKVSEENECSERSA